MNRILFIAISFLFLMASCSKDDYTTEPQLKFLKFSRNTASNQMLNPSLAPVLILKVTDKEGDIGYKKTADTLYATYAYVKNPARGTLDSSLVFPDLQTVTGPDFKAEVEINMFSFLGGNDRIGRQRPYTDTIRYEVYIKDFAGHKSNTVITEPFIYTTY